MALDEPKENDSTFDKDGLTFLVDKALAGACGAIKIDFIDAGMRSGFSITSAQPVGGGGGCGSSCGSSCGS